MKKPFYWIKFLGKKLNSMVFVGSSAPTVQSATSVKSVGPGAPAADFLQEFINSAKPLISEEQFEQDKAKIENQIFIKNAQMADTFGVEAKGKVKIINEVELLRGQIERLKLRKILPCIDPKMIAWEEEKEPKLLVFSLSSPYFMNSLPQFIVSLYSFRGLYDKKRNPYALNFEGLIPQNLKEEIRKRGNVLGGTAQVFIVTGREGPKAAIVGLKHEMFWLIGGFEPITINKVFT